MFQKINARAQKSIKNDIESIIQMAAIDKSLGRKVIKVLLNYTLKPYLKYIYLSRQQAFTFDGLQLKINPGVFHPGLFYSSKLFCEFINRLPLQDAKLLDVGCGSGLLSLFAAKRGALVTAIDINALAVKNTKQNGYDNQLEINGYESDLFDSVDDIFDYIVINPPYFPRKAKSSAEQAWYCGESFEYFKKFFSELHTCYREKSEVYMILSDGCDLLKINQIASESGYQLSLAFSRNFILESNFIFKIVRAI